MADLALTRSADDRRLYLLDDLGTLRLEGFASRAATIEDGESTWRIARHGFWGRHVHATDRAGIAVGAFHRRGLRRGGRLRWAGRELALRPASSWRERYALMDADRELALLDGRGWGRRPVRVTVADGETVEPGLLLFAAFVVRSLAQDAASAAGGGSVAATSGG